MTMISVSSLVVQSLQSRASLKSGIPETEIAGANFRNRSPEFATYVLRLLASAQLIGYAARDSLCRRELSDRQLNGIPAEAPRYDGQLLLNASSPVESASRSRPPHLYPEPPRPVRAKLTMS